MLVNPGYNVRLGCRKTHKKCERLPQPFLLLLLLLRFLYTFIPINNSKVVKYRSTFNS